MYARVFLATSLIVWPESFGKDVKIVWEDFCSREMSLSTSNGLFLGRNVEAERDNVVKKCVSILR
jgi:hypothetical protein